MSEDKNMLDDIVDYLGNFFSSDKSTEKKDIIHLLLKNVI